MHAGFTKLIARLPLTVLTITALKMIKIVFSIL